MHPPATCVSRDSFDPTRSLVGVVEAEDSGARRFRHWEALQCPHRSPAISSHTANSQQGPALSRSLASRLVGLAVSAERSRGRGQYCSTDLGPTSPEEEGPLFDPAACRSGLIPQGFVALGEWYILVVSRASKPRTYSSQMQSHHPVFIVHILKGHYMIM